MSGMALEYVVMQDIPSQRAKLVAIAIAYHVSNDTGTAYPSVTRLMKMSSMSERTTQAGLIDLCKMGVISREERRRPDGTRTSDLYVLIGFKEWLHHARSMIPGGANHTPRKICGMDVDTPQDLRDPPADVAGEQGIEPVKPSSLRSEGPSTDVAGSDSANAVFWKTSLALLKTVHADKKEGVLRGLIGKWLKRAGGDAEGLSAILAGAQKAGTLDVISYMTKTINEKYEPPQTPDTFSEEKWAIIADMVVSDRKWDSSLGPAPGKKGCRMPKKFITSELEQALGLERTLI